MSIDQANKQSLSVVIATLGGDSLQATIDSLNQSSIKPEEIIIAIPVGFEERVATISAENVQILVTQSKGQVSQRCEGFSAAKYYFILQCDDDILLAENCIEELMVASNSMGNTCACASSLFFVNSNKSVYQQTNKGWLTHVYYALLNGREGFKEGVVTKAGTEIGVDTSQKTGQDIIPVEWLPGGLVLHRRENLILNNYFPHVGKAYGEDLYHSFELRKLGISLYVVKEAQAWIDDPRDMELPSFFMFFKNLKKDFEARKYYVRMSHKSLFRTYFFYLFISLSFVVKKVKH
ncbi:glycosyltransferase family 2 protein [Aquirufa salirivi]|uniref:Glycosyltransferase 2-like domain-containing protein n=1 Tax=Aquirufa salirivi TaxID=3104729 RepID=A0ABW8RTL5_9BACT